MKTHTSPENPRLIDHGPQLVGLFVFVLTLWAQVADAYVGRFIGDGLNLVLAKAISRGDGLMLVQFPDLVPARWIYPLYPSVVSLVGRVWPAFPDNLVLIQILDSALLGCAAWIVSLQVRTLDFSPLGGCLAVALGFANPSILSLAASAFAEPLFLVIAATAVLIADRPEINRVTAVASGALAGASAITGSLGVFVIAGIVVALVVRRRFSLAVVAAVVAAIILIPWVAWSVSVDDPSGLAAGVVASARQAAELEGPVSWLGFGPLVDLLLWSVPEWIQLVAGAVAIGFFGVGVLAVFKGTPALATVTSLCVVGAWLHPAAVPRNEWILFPWWVVLVSMGAWRSWGHARSLRVPVFAAVVVLGLAYVPATVASLARRDFAASLEEQNDHLRMLVMSINAELPDSAVIASDAEAMVHLYTGRLVMPARTSQLDVDDGVTNTYCDAGVTHVARTGLRVPAPVDDEHLDNLGPSISSVFELTDGPALYRFTCPR